jgi:PAS domain S-box-containing protein
MRTTPSSTGLIQPFAGAVRELSTADWIVASTALFIVANGISICIGWWGHIPLLVQLFSDDAPTHFNTALGFIFLGVGELALVTGRRRLAATMAAAVIGLAGIELAEFLLAFKGGIDTLFAVPFVGIEARYPGRMSGNTIACFLLLGCAQLLASRPNGDASAATTAAVVLKTLAAAIAFAALLGYVVGFKTAYGWSTSVGMSVRTWAGILLIFIASIAALWRRDLVDKPSLPNWFLPFLGITTSSIGISLFWIRSSPAVRPFMLDPLYAASGHRMTLAVALSIGTLISLGTISILAARHKAVTAGVSEDRFRTLANSMPQLAWMGRADGYLLWYNQRWHEYTGTTREEMEGSGWQSVHDPAVLPAVISKWSEAIELQQPFEMEFPLRGADGTYRDFLTRAQPMKDAEGRLVQWFGTCTDVDQLKRIEQSLRVTQARLESTLEASSVGTWTWDIASDLLIADDFTARLFSIDANEAAQGLPAAAYLEVVHEQDRAQVAASLESAIQLCGAYDIEYRIRQSDGGSLWVQARGRVESDGAGNATYFHGAVIDITDRKLWELSLRDNNERLERSNRDLEDFAYIASHDLKTPLSGIKSAALWLGEDLHDLSDESRKLLGLMQSRINRMETLLDDLLAYSRVGRTDATPRETNIDDMFASIIEVLNPPAHIQVRLANGVPSIMVRASAQLELVLRNLINNAIKHHDKPRGEVVLSAKQAGTSIEFAVRDDGPGILPQFHGKIFQLFQTLKRRDEVEGSGMGLALVKKLVEQQISRITVHSQGDGTGAEFRFQWPAAILSVAIKEIANG